MKRIAMRVIILTSLIFYSCNGSFSKRDFAIFSADYTGCYDRDSQPYTFAVDTHNHFQPFGGAPIPFDIMLEYLQKSGVHFVNIYGIGQKLPAKSPCTYYLDCPGTSVTPSMTNDFVNATNISIRLPGKLPKNVHITLSMSFTDLAEPHWIVPRIALLDKEYPGMFTWMGEINMVKQALFNNGHKATPASDIPKWRGFMSDMKNRGIPVSFHSDLGNNKNPTRYLHLMQKILKTYPKNIIVWHHMGLSKELDKMDPVTHIEILSKLLNKYPKLYIDISWRVLYDNYFKDQPSRQLYVEFLNKYFLRILPGTDFVASSTKTFDDYKEEVELNSDILKDVNDEAFRNIALGENYFNMLNLPYKAPKICHD